MWLQVIVPVNKGGDFMKKNSTRFVLGFQNRNIYLDSGENAPEFGKGNNILCIETIFNDELSEILLNKFKETKNLEELKKVALEFYNQKRQKLGSSTKFEEDRIKIHYNFSPQI